MDKTRLSFVKFVNGESRYFPEDIYDVQFHTENGLTVIHKESKSISLEAAADKVLYVRYHLPLKSKREDTEDQDDSE